MALEYAFVINPFIVISIAVLLYGIYLILFPSALYLLSRNNGPQAQRRVFVPALVALFIFATAALVLDIVGSAGGIILTFEDFNGEVTSATQAKSKVLFLNILEEMVLLMYTFANIAADTILLYRLYAVWGFRKRVIALPVIIVILNNALAILDAAIRLRVALIVDGPQDQTMSPSDIFWVENATAMTLAFMIVNLLVNALVTSLIAGRIWWISRSINVSYGRNGSQQKYKRIIAIILESGVLYPVAILVALLVGQLVVPSPNLFAILAEVVAISPTLIIVRVAMGVNVDLEQTSAKVYNYSGSSGTRRPVVGGATVSTARFASREQLTSVLDITHSSIDEDDVVMEKGYRKDFV